MSDGLTVSVDSLLDSDGSIKNGSTSGGGIQAS
jgi:hypothetical protein